MQYRVLGRTGLEVSVISLGTVALGMDYGIGGRRPAEADAVELILAAVERGVNLFDTAPGYGESERLVGQALAAQPTCLIATKVSVPRDAFGVPLTGAAAREDILHSLLASRKKLRRDVIDFVQIHCRNEDRVDGGEVLEALQHAQREGDVRFLGVSVYSEEQALAAIASGAYAMIQLAYNVLDQRKAARVFPAAEAAGVGILARSALLKGVLTARAELLPARLAELRTAARKVRDRLAGEDWKKLPEVALRFAFSDPRVASVLVGFVNRDELEGALAAEARGPLSAPERKSCAALALDEDQLVNPSKW